MKEVIAYLTIWSLCITVGITASSTHRLQKRTVDENDLESRQKNLNQLLVRVHLPNANAEQSAVGAVWDIEAQAAQYTNADAVDTFLASWKGKVVLPRGKVFTLLNDEYVEQAIALFDLFYFAKDFDTFYKTACWARDHINEGMFVYSFYVAVLHRNDTQHMTIPAISEVMPHFFVDARTIQKAYDARTGDTDSLVLPTIESSTSTQNSRLAIYTEDLGLNEFYATFMQRSPFWMTERKYGKSIRRLGELFYYIHKQLLARYNLQRIAAGLPLTEPLRLGAPIADGYSSHLRYPDGAEIPSRPNDFKIQSWADSKVLDYERRIRDAIDLGYVITKNGSLIPLYNEEAVELFGKLITGGLSSPNIYFYGWVVRGWRTILSRTADPLGRLGLAPGVTAQDTTVLRDPAFFQALARILEMSGQFEDRFTRLILSELEFPGVRVESVQVDELETFKEEVDVPLDNVVGAPSGARARMQRLAHRPFGVNVTVHSEVDTTAMMRIFLGPKMHAEGNITSINEWRHLMVEMDRFPFKLTSGQNVIRRQSLDSTFGKTESKDGNGKTAQRNIEVDKLCGFPQRLLLPKVHQGTMSFVLFVMITPYEGPMEVPQAFGSCGAGFNNKYPDTHPMGYPFHNPINEWDFYTPNMHFQDVFISHSTETVKRL